MQIDEKAWSYVERNSDSELQLGYILKTSGSPTEEHDVTYENAQARERTQILMDLANKTNGMVIRNRGYCQELALGMGNFTVEITCLCIGVNASVPKTLVVSSCKILC